MCGFIPFYTFRHYFNASMTFGNIVQIVFSSCAVKKLPSISDFSSVAIPFWMAGLASGWTATFIFRFYLQEKLNILPPLSVLKICIRILQNQKKIKINIFRKGGLWFRSFPNCGLSGSLSLTPDSHGTDSIHAYTERRDACHISHTDGDNAPAS